MKSKALYHLLLDRARHIRVHGSSDVAQFITDIEDSLTVDFDKGEYTIQWRYQNTQHSIEMKDSDFRFYIRGDLGKPPTLRDVRRGNWDAALDMWKRMAQESGQHWPHIVEESQNTMGLDLARAEKDKGFTTHLAILGLIALFIGLFSGGLGLGAGAALAGIALTLISKERDGLKRAPWPDKVNAALIILPAALIPAFLPHEGTFSLALIIALGCAINLLEKHKPFEGNNWLFCGGAMGLVAWMAGSAGLSWALIAFAVFVALIVAILPERFDRVAAYRLCGLIVIGAILGVESAPGLEVTPAIWLLVILFATLSAIGWFIGELFTLTPWLIHILIGFVALASAITGDINMAGACFLAFGFIAVESVRLVMALRGTRAVPLTKPEGAAS